ncbi:MAG: glycosyltransferase family 2 protein [Candidatus Nanopelagicales bacterium]
MGTRPAELLRGLESVLAQTGVTVEVVCVGNGWDPVGLPAGVRSLALPENVGIPAGRNAGVPEVAGDYLFFLDDDAELLETDTLARFAAIFAARPEVGLIQPRVIDTSGKTAPGRWVPRLRTGDPAQSSPATSLWEGAVAMRREVFAAIGGWPELFWYAHEGIEVAWRTWDASYVPWYAGDIAIHHPVIDPRRHAEFFEMNARNRVLLARRNLPAVLEPLYTGNWAAITAVRVRDKASRAAWFAGFREGWRMDPGARRPMSWRTVWRMTRAGRPPVI